MSVEIAARRELVFAISADYERRTGGWIYDQRLMRELRQRGWNVRDLVLPAGFPRPDDAARAESSVMLDRLPEGSIVMIDQLCLGVMPDIARQQSRRLHLAMIVHHPLSLETGMAEHERVAFAQLEREALSHVARVIVTSQTTANDLKTNFAVPEQRIVVAPPGVDRLPPAMGADGPPAMLSVGAVVPRKDHGTLIMALAGLRKWHWHLTIVGNLSRTPEHVAEIRRLIARHGLSDRMTLAGEREDADLELLWQSADLYAAASRHEGFGMAIAEAVARGLPVVSTAAGAVSEWLGDQAAILVAPGDVEALRAGLGRVLSDPGVRASLRQGARAARERLPRWEKTAVTVETALDRLAAG